jgi:hypothetical protein
MTPTVNLAPTQVTNLQQQSLFSPNYSGQTSTTFPTQTTPSSHDTIPGGRGNLKTSLKKRKKSVSPERKTSGGEKPSSVEEKKADRSPSPERKKGRADQKEESVEEKRRKHGAGPPIPNTPIQTDYNHNGAVTGPEPLTVGPSGQPNPQATTLNGIMPQPNTTNASLQRTSQGEIDATNTLVQNGWQVFYRPNVLLSHSEAQRTGLAAGKYPDMVVEGKYFDIFTSGALNPSQPPQTAMNAVLASITNQVKTKTNTHQAHGIVVNLNHVDASVLSPQAVSNHLQGQSLPNAHQVLATKGNNVYQLLPSYRQF